MCVRSHARPRRTFPITELSFGGRFVDATEMLGDARKNVLCFRGRIGEPAGERADRVARSMRLLEFERQHLMRDAVKRELDPAAIARFDDAVHLQTPFDVADPQRAAVQGLEKPLSPRRRGLGVPGAGGVEDGHGLQVHAKGRPR
jgi:hypothetical protein